MEFPVEILQQLNITELLAIAAMLWVFNSRLDKKFEKIDDRFEKMDQRFEKMDQRFEKIEARITQVEHDLVEIKTVLRLKECCMIKDESQVKKAE